MRILFLETRELSYSSSSVFMNELKKAFLKLGDEVLHYIVKDINQSEEILEDILAMSHTLKFDFIFDINSILPLLYEDDKPYLNCFKVPFVDYIVDHPIHQAHVLDRKLDNFNVICLDSEHCDYIKTCYPNIRNTIAMPLAACTQTVEKISLQESDERKIDVLFPATFTPVSYFEDILKDKGKRYLDYAKECIDMIKSGEEFAVCDMRKRLLETDNQKHDILPDVSRYIDKYIREYLRQMTVEALLSVGISLDVVGARWEMYDGKYHNRLNIHEQTGYGNIAGFMQMSKAVLNVQPLFKNAPHDRIYNAMANGAVVITDYVTGLNVYEEGKDYLKYNFSDLKKDFERIKNIISDNNKIDNMRQSAYQKVMKNDTWEERCRKIKKIVKNLS